MESIAYPTTTYLHTRVRLSGHAHASMPPPVRSLRSLAVKRRCIIIPNRCASTTQPPPSPRPYKAAPSRTPHPKQPSETNPVAATTSTPAAAAANPNIEPRAGILRYFWPFSKGIQKEAPSPRPAPDPARGKEATDRVVQTGVLDPRYKDAAFKVTALISALPVVIYLGYVLFQRRFEGVEKRSLPRVKRQEELR